MTLQRKFDSAYAELYSQLAELKRTDAELKEPERESELKRTEAELRELERAYNKRIEVEFRKLEKAYRKSERARNLYKRERNLYKHRYVSLLNSRAWRHTLPARKLGTLIRYIFRPKSRSHPTNTDPGEQELQARGEPLSKSEKSATGKPSPTISNSLLTAFETASDKGDTVEYVEPTARGKSSGQATDKSRDLEKYEKQLRRIRKKLARSERTAECKAKVTNHTMRLRTLGFTECALKKLQNFATDDSKPTLQRVAAWELSLWYADQYSEQGARQCLELLPVALQGKDVSVSLRRRAAVVEAECQELLGNTEAAKFAISHALESGPHADLFLANANLEVSASAKMEWINKALQLYGIPEISFDVSAGLPFFDSLRPRQDKQERVEVPSDAKVSVIIPVYNAEDTIQTALDSVLSQTWTNLEVLVVDDCSTDATVSIVEGYVSRHSRVQLIRAKTNGGPYVARNLALRAATGVFVTCHDADDWSHPEKIEKQVQHLLSNPLVVGNTSQQARATSDLKFNRKGKEGYYIYLNTPSFMFRREPMMDAVGYYDCVRFGADIEFRSRITKVFGNESVVDLKTGPLAFHRESSSSLTGSEYFGYSGAMRGCRKEYFESYTFFHDTAETLRYEFPQDVRPFAVPEPMWPTREVKKAERRHFDVIVVSDFRLPGGTTSSNVEEIKAQKQMGLRTGLIQMGRYRLEPNRPINPKVRELLDGEQVHMLVYGEKVSCDTLILKHPPILQEWQQFIPDVEAANVHVIVNQTPMSDYGDEAKLEYTISRCKNHLEKYFGQAGIWHPIGPSIREALHHRHAEELTELTLAEEDWLEIIDVNEWRRESRPLRGPGIRIGRHSRDQDVKWPKDTSQLLAVYPDSGDYEVHVLGGAEAPRKVLGGLPKNWHVLEFGEVHPKDFLSTLDVFVYYTQPELVEAFGRTILEAMAVGVPVILPYSFRELFQEAAIYAEPAEVKRSIDWLMSDDDYYESQVGIAQEYVEEHFGYTVHAKRLRKAKLTGKQTSPSEPHFDSESYWVERYLSGRTSGAGSYNKLAEYKAQVLNDFVRRNDIQSVIEYGCGDGNQLKLATYPNYLGFDVSPQALATCRNLFRGDHTKSFKLMKEYEEEKAELTLSLDVIFHLVEDEVFESYMRRLFDSSNRFVIIYSSDFTTEEPAHKYTRYFTYKTMKARHVKHRKFTEWVENNRPAFKLFQHIPNAYPFTGDLDEGSFADFYIYEKG